jgi:serine/threonine-protein kinase
MAAVYLARDTELDRLVAVKLLSGPLDPDSDLRARFEREARTAARLSHPNLVRVFDTGEDDGRPYIVMEYVEGETLAELIRRRRRLPADEAVAFALQAAAGVAHVHEAGLVHRDLKPQNLLVRGDGTLKVADFGIAWAAESTRLTHAGTVLGTAEYLAPEQAVGGDVSAAADVYSLGAVLYETLTGRTPHTFASLAEIVEKQRTEPVIPVRELEPAVPRELEDVVMRCLARDPRYRPPDAGAVAAALAGLAPDAPTRPLARETATAPLRTPAPRVTPRLAAAAAALVLLAVAVALVAALGGGGSSARPRPVAPVPHVGDAAAQAAKLSEWLRRHSR